MSAVTPSSTPAKSSTSLVSKWGLVAGGAVLVAIIMLPQPAGLSIAGQHMLGIFAFAVIIWMTESVEYAASSVMLVALMAFLLSTAPDPAHPDHILGTSGALSTAMDGFTNPAVALIAASLVIATAMAVTGLDKRVAFMVISLIGTSRSRLLIGTIVVMAILAFFVPTASARVACLVPIILGMISALGMEKKSRVAGMLMMSIVYLSLIWAIGIATGAAQNVYVNALLDRTIHIRISWIDWLIVGGPYSIAMSIALYFVLMKMMAPTATEAAGSKISTPADLGPKLGPISADEIKLLIFSAILLAFWATEGKLHSFDSSSVAIAAVALMFMPKIGVISWKQVQSRIPWGVLIQLGVGVGLGTALLKTGAAAWLATYVVNEFGVQQLSIFAILAVLWLFLILIHLGFSSGAAMTMLLTFVTSVGWILPINGPQNMLAFGTDTFEARDFIRVGVVLTIIAYVMLLIFATTYWRWLGYV